MMPMDPGAECPRCRETFQDCFCSVFMPVARERIALLETDLKRWIDQALKAEARLLELVTYFDSLEWSPPGHRRGFEWMNEYRTESAGRGDTG